MTSSSIEILTRNKSLMRSQNLLTSYLQLNIPWVVHLECALTGYTPLKFFSGTSLPIEPHSAGLQIRL